MLMCLSSVQSVGRCGSGERPGSGRTCRRDLESGAVKTPPFQNRPGILQDVHAALANVTQRPGLVLSAIKSVSGAAKPSLDAFNMG